jgi:hypothetical protein
MNSIKFVTPIEEHDDSMERLLSEDVAQAYDAPKKDPERGVPATQTFANIRSRRRGTLLREKPKKGDDLICIIKSDLPKHKTR